MSLDIDLISWIITNKFGILFGFLVTITLEVLFWLLARNVFDGINQTENSLDIQGIQQSGITAFYTCRKDYTKYRKSGGNVDEYILTADSSITMVSINLTTGLDFDGLSKIFRNQLEQKKIKITVSLLNPLKDELMIVFAPILDKKSEKLSEEIQDNLNRLLNLKNDLSKEAQDRFNIRVHNSIPFASAILLDKENKNGKIQLETKPYKSPINSSFGFEVSNINDSQFFKSLVEGYENLIDDGEDYETLLTK